jgi:hypothetical protein
MRLGDLVFYITKYTGINWVVKSVSKMLGVDCGCEQRRQDWNNLKIDRYAKAKDE